MLKALVDGDDRVDDGVEDRALRLETPRQLLLRLDLARDVATGGKDPPVTALAAPLDPTVGAVAPTLTVAKFHQGGVRGGGQSVELAHGRQDVIGVDQIDVGTALEILRVSNPCVRATLRSRSCHVTVAAQHRQQVGRVPKELAKHCGVGTLPGHVQLLRSVSTMCELQFAPAYVHHLRQTSDVSYHAGWRYLEWLP
jgi:hypothetical protein